MKFKKSLCALMLGALIAQNPATTMIAHSHEEDENDYYFEGVDEEKADRAFGLIKNLLPFLPMVILEFGYKKIGFQRTEASALANGLATIPLLASMLLTYGYMEGNTADSARLSTEIGLSGLLALSDTFNNFLAMFPMAGDVLKCPKDCKAICKFCVVPRAGQMLLYYFAMEKGRSWFAKSYPNLACYVAMEKKKIPQRRCLNCHHNPQAYCLSCTKPNPNPNTY